MCLISFKNKMIFIFNHKTGSTSLVDFLKKNKIATINVWNIKNINNTNKTNKNYLFHNKKHSNLESVLKTIKNHNKNMYKIVKNYDVIVFTRNPIERMISLYFYKSDNINKYYTDFPNCLNESICKMIENNNYEYFKDFIKNAYNHSKKVRVFKLENLNNFFNYLKKKNIKIKHNFTTKNTSKKNEYSLKEETKQKIKDYFNFEINKFYPSYK